MLTLVINVYYAIDKETLLAEEGEEITESLEVSCWSEYI